MMLDMDTEVSLKIIEQSPVFKDFAIDAVDAMEKSHQSTLKANRKVETMFTKRSKGFGR